MYYILLNKLPIKSLIMLHPFTSTLCISLPSEGHPGVIQETPIYQVGNQWCNTKNYHWPGADFVVYHGMIESSSSDIVIITAQWEGRVTWRGSQLLSVLVIWSCLQLHQSLTNTLHCSLYGTPVRGQLQTEKITLITWTTDRLTRCAQFKSHSELLPMKHLLDIDNTFSQ